MAALLAVPFLVLGVYAGMCAISRWARGYSGHWIFTPTGAAIELSLLICSGMLFFFTMLALSATNSGWLLFLFALMPFAIGGHVLWGFAAVLELVWNAAGPSNLPVEKTFDKGDALLARARYAEAEAQYRRDLAEEPLNVDALLRICRALEAAGRYEDAVRELAIAHQNTMDRKDQPPLEESARSARLLRLTYALGDLLATRVQRPEEARRLYERSLEMLFGFPEADPLRDRLRTLEEGRTGAADAGPPDSIQL